MVRITFSDHARAQLRERKLSKNLILDAVRRPDKIFQQSINRYRAQKILHKGGGKYLLIVVYDEIDRAREIVTAFLTTKFKKYL